MRVISTAKRVLFHASAAGQNLCLFGRLSVINVFPSIVRTAIPFPAITIKASPFNKCISPKAFATPRFGPGGSSPTFRTVVCREFPVRDTNRSESSPSCLGQLRWPLRKEPSNFKSSAWKIAVSEERPCSEHKMILRPSGEISIFDPEFKSAKLTELEIRFDSGKRNQGYTVSQSCRHEQQDFLNAR